MNSNKRRLISVITASLLALSASQVTSATATWSDNGVQWRVSKPFVLNLIDHTTTQVWHDRVALAAADWSASSTADIVVNGNGKIKATVSNGPGQTAPCAWSTITLQGSYLKSVSIFLNDTCLDLYAPNWSFSYYQMALCNEIGHALGMPDHRTDTPAAPDCMAPGTNPGPSPAQEDFDKLSSLYP